MGDSSRLCHSPWIFAGSQCALVLVLYDLPIMTLLPFQTVVGSKRLLNNANWARYNLAVSVQKDSEPASSSMWNANLPGAPVVDFHDFFDGENITQKDLVAWVNVGTHHLPGAEDTPNTKMNTATSRYAGAT